MAESVSQAASEERRLLLRHLLKSLQLQGRTILLPVGCSGFENWLLDKVDVAAVLDAVAAGGDLDLMRACHAPAQSTPPRRGSLLGRAVPRTPDPGTEVSSADAADAGPPRGADPAERALVLSIHDATLDLDDSQLKDLTYATFLGAAGKHASPTLLTVLRGQLEVSAARSQELEAVARLGGADTKIGSLEMHAHLLKVVRPASFSSFKNFVRWRRTVSATLWCVLRQAATERWGGGSEGSARALLARLRGALRRADVPDADEYDEREYTEAADGVAAAAAAVAAACSSGWRFSWLLCASIADRLLRGTFDSLTESEYVAESDELVALLRAHVWPALGITPDLHLALYAWVHFRQFTLSGEGRLLDSANAIIKAMDAPEGEARGEAGVGDGGAALPPPLSSSAQVLTCLSAAVLGLLSDYHGAVGSQTALARLLALSQSVERALGALADLPAALRGAIRASVQAEFGRRARACAAAPGASPAAEGEAAATLAATATELLRTELRAYSPLLLPIEPRARGVAARALQDAFGATFLPWVVGVSTLDRATLEALRIGIALEEFLVKEAREDPGETWGLQARVNPLLYRWVESQSSMLRGWVSRIMASEDWMKHGRQPGRGARSTTEAVKAATDTLEGLFTLGMTPLPSGVVRCLVDGVDGALGEYASALRSGLPSVAGLRPPRPQLTRYKREVVDAAAEAEAVDGRMGLEAVSWLPPLGRAEAEGVMAVTYDALILRANSAAALLDALGDLERLVIDGWQEAGRGATVVGGVEGGAGGPRPAAAAAALATPYDVSGLDWTTGMFGTARANARAAQAATCHAVACRLVYGDLRTAIFERLYRFHVQAARIDAVLQEVDRVLGMLCSQAHDSLPPLLARALCTELLSAFASVLLDGGPLRLFVPADVDALESDLTAIQALFHAEADGLELEEVEHASAPLSAILDAMALDTSVLIANYKQAMALPARPLASTRHGAGPPPPAALDPDVLLRVLCHRAEHPASKFLKGLKISKRLPMTPAGQAGEVLQKVKSKTSPGLLRSFTGPRKNKAKG